MQANCPKCNQVADFPDSLAGNAVRCPSCGGLVELAGVAAASGDAAGAAAAPAASGSVFAELPGAQVTDSAVLDPNRVAAAQPRPFWVKAVLVGVPVLAILGVLGTYLGIQMERQAYAKRVDGQFTEAEQVYRDGKMEDCDRLLTEAVKLLEARPEAVPAEWAGRMRKQAQDLRAHIGRWREAGEVMKGVRTEPAATRRKLEDLYKFSAALGEDAKPVAELIREMGQKAYDEELADRRRGLDSHMASLQAQLDEGAFESAREALKVARDRVAAAGGEMAKSLDKTFRPRFEELDTAIKTCEEIDKIVKAAPPGGPKRAAVEAEILKRKAELTASGAAAKGFARRFDKWVAEIRTDRRGLPSPVGMGRQALEELAKDFAAALPGLTVAEDGLDEARSIIRLKGAGHSWRIMAGQMDGRPIYMIEIDGVRLAYPAPARQIDPGVRRALIRYEMNQAPVLARALKAWGRDEAWSATPWVPIIDGQARGAEPLALLGGKGLLCTSGRVWTAEVRNADADLRAAAQVFVESARALEEAIGADTGASKELRAMLTMMVKSAYQQRKSASDFLPRQFCSDAVARGYIEKNAPELAARIEAKIADYRKAYLELTRFRTALAGKTDAGDEIELGANADGRTIWRIFDAKAGAAGITTFALHHNDEQFDNQFFVHSLFAGKHASWPATEAPLSVRMVHLAAGEVARWDAATDKLTFDAARWRLAVELEEFRKPPAHFGAPDWRFPPHVLLIDSAGGALGLVTPAGRLDMPEFGKRAGEERRKAQDAFLDKCAKCLPGAGELHLFFRYFVKYTYDSPLTDYPFLIGDKQNTGDVHQDAYQTLDRKIAGRFIADCDDLAELYQDITRRQKRLSYVLGQPSHAICGFVERAGQDYVFTVVDTGPPRQFRAARMDDALEAGYATFDEERTEAFDPNSLCFLLRFAGEPTRTPYYLGARMFLDPQYAETMIRVQRDWHFAYIISGRETMVEMVKREKDPPTLFELAAFYRELGDWPLAVEWSRKGIAAMPPDDLMGRLSEHMRLAMYLERSGDREAAVKVLVDDAAELAKAEGAAGAKAERFVGIRLNLAAQLDALDRPWEGWKTAAPAAKALAGAGQLGGDNATRLATMLLSMRDLEAAGKKPAGADASAAKDIEVLLARALADGHFKEEDTFHSLMDKYADLAVYYAAKYGRDHAMERLLAPGPYPSAPRAHHRRVGGPAALEDEDWKWIRVSVHAYAYFFNEALDQRKPVAERRTADAVKILAALEKALPEVEKQGSLAGMEFAVLSMRVRRDAITKNWQGTEEVFKKMRQRNWARLHRVVAMSLGEAASYMTPAEFEAQFRKFSEQDPPLPHYFRTAYAALENKCYAAALAAGRITAERFPNDPDVQREYRLLQELVAKRTGAQEPKEAPKPPPVQKEPEGGAGGAAPGPRPEASSRRRTAA